VIWNRSQWVKDPDSGKRLRRERPRSEWIVTEVPRVIDEATWRRVQGRTQERGGCGAGPGGQPKYVLSGLLLCKRCGGRLIVTGAKGSHYYCGTHRQGGEHACDMGLGVRRDVAEDVMLRPIVEDMLSPAGVALAVELIRRWAQQDRATTVSGPTPEVADIDARIARLQAQVDGGVLELVDVAPSLEALEARREAVLKAAWRHAATKASRVEVPAERLYSAAAASFRERLMGRNLIAKREALRELMEPAPVWPHESGEFLMVRVGLNATPLLKAAGIASSGSGGLLWSRATLELELRRAA
jgi:site-specific DNA recombinase